MGRASEAPQSPYRRLQARAKAAGIPANRSAKALAEALAETLGDDDAAQPTPSDVAGLLRVAGSQADENRLDTANAAASAANAGFFSANDTGGASKANPPRRIVLPFITILLAAQGGDSASAPAGGGDASMVDWLRGYAAQWWYPWVVGVGSGVNNFTVVLSAPLVVLFLSGVYANPKMRYLTAFANAVGTTAGIALLIYFMQTNDEYMGTMFAAELDSPVAKRTREYCELYGIYGAVIISIMPIFLQPLVFIGITVAKMNAATLVGCVLFGRTLKYIIMAELAIVAPNLLKFFGSAAVDASKKIREEGAKQD